MSRSTAAGALIVIDVETRSSGIPPSSVQRVDGHADLPHLAVDDRGIGVISHLGGQVERDGKPGRACLDKLVIAAVRLGCGREAGVLAHGPRPAGIHLRIDAAGKWILARPA
jgi:hypothetical protein